MMSDIAVSTTQDSPEKICKLCRRQFAKYSCPTCNVPYCSLTCFRSEAHNQCSETFYRKELESGIQSEKSKSAEERLRMLEILKQFEEESAANELPDDDEDSSDDELSRKLQNIDLNSASATELWAFLTPEQRKKFTHALQDPSSELAQQLLTSESLNQELLLPWWEDSSSVDQTEPSSSSVLGVPKPIKIPTSMVNPSSDGPLLVYNTAALLIAYAHSIRSLAISSFQTLRPSDPDFLEARQVFTKLAPFVSDRKSRTVLPNVASLVTDIWSRFDEGHMTRSFFAILLRDAARLLRPLPVTVISPPPVAIDEASFDSMSHPHRHVVLALSDIHNLFDDTQRQRLNHVSHKLVFYASRLLSMPSAVLRHVSEEMIAEVRRMESDPSVHSDAEIRTS